MERRADFLLFSYLKPGLLPSEKAAYLNYLLFERQEPIGACHILTVFVPEVLGEYTFLVWDPKDHQEENHASECPTYAPMVREKDERNSVEEHGRVHGMSNTRIRPARGEFHLVECDKLLRPGSADGFENPNEKSALRRLRGCMSSPSEPRFPPSFLAAMS